jgi:small-conductance mechanosensitive channel
MIGGMMPWDQTFWTDTINQILSSISSWLPAVLSALLLLVVGWLIASISQALIKNLLSRLGLDRLAERTGIAQGLTAIGVQNNLSFILGRTVYWLILIFFVLLALGELGLTDVVTTALNGFFTFIPRLVAATIIFLIGAFIARIVGDGITAMTAQSNITNGRILGQAVRFSILLMVVILSLNELGVQTTILTTVIIIVVAAVALGLAVAFGLGNRQLAHSIMAGFHAREEFNPGQTLTIGEYTGTLVRIGATKTLLETSNGLISLPNIFLLNEIVKLDPGDKTAGKIDDQPSLDNQE